MVMNISCKFEKASYNTFFVRVAMVNSLYILQRLWRNKAKSIVSTGYNYIGQHVFYHTALKGCRVLFSPIFSGWAGVWVEEKIVQAVSQKPKSVGS